DQRRSRRFASRPVPEPFWTEGGAWFDIAPRLSRVTPNDEIDERMLRHDHHPGWFARSALLVPTWSFVPRAKDRAPDRSTSGRILALSPVQDVGWVRHRLAICGSKGDDWPA